MGWAEEHLNMVADRWWQKYKESGMSPEVFSKYMTETMKQYGWSAEDIKKMVARAIGMNKRRQTWQENF